MENRAHAFAAGLFVILLSAAMAMAIKWFSSEGVTYNPYFLISEGGSVSGLNPEASVRYRGVNVGKVEDIYFDRDNIRNIIVRIAVTNNVVLPENIYAQLASQGITGLAYIELNDDVVPEAGIRQLEAGASIPLRSSLIKTLSDSLEDILKNSNIAIRRINSLLNEQNQTHIGNILNHLEQTLQHYDELTEQIHSSLQTLPKLTGEITSTFQQTRQVLGNATQVLQRLDRQGGLIDNLAQGSQEMADTLSSLKETSIAITQSTRILDQLLYSLEAQPQSLIFGKPPASPGPGEPGFSPPEQKKR